MTGDPDSLPLASLKKEQPLPPHWCEPLEPHWEILVSDKRESHTIYRVSLPQFTFSFAT